MNGFAASDETKPRRSIYPAPSTVASSHRTDVKPDTKPKIKPTGRILQDLNLLEGELSGSGGGGGGRDGRARELTHPDRRGSGGEYDIKPDADSLDYQDRVRAKQEHAGMLRSMDDEVRLHPGGLIGRPAGVGSPPAGAALILFCALP